jgi:hypothetical protein
MKILSLGVKQDNNHSLTPNKEATEPRVTNGYVEVITSKSVTVPIKLLNNYGKFVLQMTRDMFRLS